MNVKESNPHTKLLYLVTEDWYFCSHRLDLVSALVKDGFHAGVATKLGKDLQRINAAGIDAIQVKFSRRLSNPLKELQTSIALIRTLAKYEPDIVNATALKPIISCILPLLIFPKVKFVHAFAGMGYLYSSSGRKGRILRPIITYCLKFVLTRRNSWVLVQNNQDKALIRAILGPKTKDHAIKLIRGVGVNTSHYAPRRSFPPVPTVILPARLLREKGVYDFVEAAALVKEKIPNAKFVLVGQLDPDNPGGLSLAEVNDICSSYPVEWWGHKDDMAEVYHSATLVCLPSSREGLPKALLEAAACGKALVATDVPGCREVCQDNKTGLLVEAGDPGSLAIALSRLLEDDKLRERCGIQARKLVEEEFSIEIIAKETGKYFREVLAQD